MIFGEYVLVSVDWSDDRIKLRAENYETSKITAVPSTLSDEDLRVLGTHLGKKVRLTLEFLPDEKVDI